MHFSTSSFVLLFLFLHVYHCFHLSSYSKAKVRSMTVNSVVSTLETVIPAIPKTDGLNSPFIDQWIENSAFEYANQISNSTALEDENIFGEYEVSYVKFSTFKSQNKNNPAGGEYTGKYGKNFFKIDRKFQNLEKDKTNGKIIAINYIIGTLLKFIPFSVILRGIATPVNQIEKETLKAKYNTEFTDTTARVDFQPPLICIGNSSKNKFGFTMQLGPTSLVYLDTPYVDKYLRVGVGSVFRSGFIFKRTFDPLAASWKNWYGKWKLPAKSIGILLFLLGLNLNVIYTLQKTSLLVSLKQKVNISGLLLSIVGLFVALSKGGIANDQIR